MSIHRTESKFKRKKTKDDTKQREYDTIVISKEKSQKAIDKFHEVPFQLKYMRTYGTNRTKQQTKGNTEKE